MDTIKSLLITVLMVISGQMSIAQGQKRFSSSILLGGGVFVESDSYINHNPGITTRLEYGLGIGLDDSWSIMPGLGYMLSLSDINMRQVEGKDHDYFECIDMFCLARRGINVNKAKMYIGFGPQLSVNIGRPDKYFINADITDPRNGLRRFKQWNLSVIPNATFLLWNHWLIGLEGNIGLRNMMIQYPEYNTTGRVHFFHLLLTTGFQF